MAVATLNSVCVLGDKQYHSAPTSTPPTSSPITSSDSTPNHSPKLDTDSIVKTPETVTLTLAASAAAAVATATPENVSEAELFRVRKLLRDHVGLAFRNRADGVVMLQVWKTPENEKIVAELQLTSHPLIYWLVVTEEQINSIAGEKLD